MEKPPYHHQSISVIIPHLNQGKQLRRCLTALGAGNRIPDEVIVVDNGSHTVPDKICRDFAWVTLISQPLKGPGLARNLGAAQATGELLAFIDADCFPDLTWLAEAENSFRDPSVQISGGDVQIACIDPLHLTAVEAYESIFAFRMDRYIKRRGFCGTGNLVVRRDVFERIGAFRGLIVAEDREWGQRASFKGYQIHYSPDQVVYHPARPSLQALQVKWDRQLTHDWVGCRSVWGRINWALKALILALSPLAVIGQIIFTTRVTGLRNRMLAYFILVRIRLFRTKRMVLLLKGADGSRHLEQWNKFDAL